MRKVAESPIAPTARIDSGHRSRSSNTHGRLFTVAARYAAQAVKNCGDVPTMTSTFFTNSDAMNAEIM